MAYIENCPYAERELLVLMLKHGDAMVELVLGHMAIDEFTDGEARRLAAMIAEAYEAGSVERDVFLSGQHGDEAQALAARLLAFHHCANPPKATPRHVAEGAMVVLKTARVDFEIKQQSTFVQRLRKTNDAALGDARQRLYALKVLRYDVNRGAFLSA